MRFQRTASAHLRRWAALFLTVAFSAGGAHAADVLPIGSIVLDVGGGSLTYGSLVETVNSVGSNSNTCQLDRTSLTILDFAASGGNLVSRGKQKGGLGIKTQGQDCAFAGGGQSWTMGLGSAVGAVASVVDWEIRFIVTDDAVFTLTTLDAGSGALQTYKIYTGKSACDPVGTSGVPKVPGPNEYVYAACTAQSNPNSNFAFVLREDLPTFLPNPPDWRQITISVESGNVGITDATFDLGATATGQLTCENESGGPSGPTITDSVEIFQAGDGVQCRRLPNRNPTTCVPVPYLLQANCTGPDGTDCEIDFLHGDQDGVQPDQFAFICEVWWPARAGNFTAGVPDEPFRNRTQVSWGGLTTPLQPSDVPLTWCPGITPLFSDLQEDEPNIATNCGTALEYKLSVPATMSMPPVDGLTVSPNSADCSLLEAYDDVLLVAPGATGDPGDQCASATCTQAGRQLACLMQERIVAEEDADATMVDYRAGPGRITAPADPNYRKGEVIFVEGDIKLRGF